MYLPSVVAICSRPCLIPPISRPYELGALFEIATLQLSMATILANYTLNIAIHNG